MTTAFLNLLKYYKPPESYMFHTYFFTIHVLSKVYLKIWNWQGLALNRNKDIISYFISNREQWKRAKFIIWCWAFKKIYQEELFVSVCHSTEVRFMRMLRKKSLLNALFILISFNCKIMKKGRRVVYALLHD